MNQKGKVIADSFVLRVAENDHLVWAPRTAAAALRERLESYLIADEVEIDDATAAHGAMAIWGEGAAAAVGARFGAVPEAGAFIGSESSGLVFRGRFSGSDNFIWLGRDVAALGISFAAAGAVTGTRDTFEAERILNGRPAVPDDIGPNDLPNEGGLDVDAISFTKGCYLGQEVMSRLKNLGQVRRRLFVIEGDGAPPAAHTPVRQGEKQAGETRSSARVESGFVAMAMISLVSFDRSAPITLVDGRALRLRHG